MSGLALSLLLFGCGGKSGPIGTIEVGVFVHSVYPVQSAAARFDMIEQDAWDANVPACSRVQLGDCEIVTCPEPTDPQVAPNLDRLDAGRLEINSNGLFFASAEPNEGGYYFFDETGYLEGGERLTVSADGGTISAFQAEIELPLPPLSTSHPESGSTHVVPRDEDLELSWDAQGTGETVDMLEVPLSREEPTYAHCSFDAAGGVGVVPSEILTDMPTYQEFGFYSLTSKTISTPRGEILVRAVMDLRDMAGDGRLVFVPD